VTLTTRLSGTVCHRVVGTCDDQPVSAFDGAVVEVVEIGDDDGDRESDGQDPGDGTQRADELAD